ARAPSQSSAFGGPVGRKAECRPPLRAEGRGPTSETQGPVRAASAGARAALRGQEMSTGFLRGYPSASEAVAGAAADVLVRHSSRPNGLAATPGVAPAWTPTEVVDNLLLATPPGIAPM